MRMAAMPQLYILEPLTEHSVLAPLSGLAVQYMFHVPFYIFIPIHLVMWCLMDYLLLAVIEVSMILILSVLQIDSLFSLYLWLF